MYDSIISELNEISNEEIKLLNQNPQKLLVTEINLVEKIIKVNKLERFVARDIKKQKYAELIYMMKGSSKHTINNETITLKDGELLIVNKKVHHKINELSKNDIALQIVIDEKFIESCIFKSDFLISFLLNIMFDTEQNLKFIRFNITDIKPAVNIIENMAYSYLNDMKTSEYSDYLYLNLLLEHLKNDYLKLKYSSNAKDVRIIIMVMKYIDDNLRDGELNQLADKLTTTPYTLSKTIKKLTGYNFKEILQDKKLDTARSLLDSTDLPISKIADIIGYENTSYFHKIFKQKFNSSPSKYRKVQLQ